MVKNGGNMTMENKGGHTKSVLSYDQEMLT